ncbi:MAG: acyl carrier protein [Archangium sp.]
MEIKNSLSQFLRTTFSLDDGAQLSDDTSLLKSGLLDSTDLLELVLYLESEFQITVGEEEAVPENLDTIGRIVAFVTSKQSAPSQEGVGSEG